MKRTALFLTVLLLALPAANHAAELRLATIFSDHMVLQREKAAPVWGWAESGEQIAVEFAGQKKSTVADAGGKWLVQLDPLPASAEPRELVVSVTNPESKTSNLKLQDVLVGEVWLGSGQSNMAWVSPAMKNALLRLTVLLLVPPAAIYAADRPTAKFDAAASPGKTCIYKHSAGQPREMEIYFPPNHDPAAAKVPGVILFHGGGWGGGSLSQFRTACQYFASRGLVAATANYQMLSEKEGQQLPQGETRKRVCITDAKSAIRWFKQHAAELGVDPRRIITGGGSAGGHISVLATLNPGLNDPADPKDSDTSVIAYLLFNPAFSPDDVRDAEVDVLCHLQPGFAPAIVFFGTEDKWKIGWDAAHERLQSLGNTAADLQLAEGQGHGFFNKDPWQTVTLIAADRFLARQGLLPGEPSLAAPATGEHLVPAPAATASERTTR